ncbi:hypothetical protein QCA50_007531 [Cerrena zonata]|uniref:Uncharacterized protein n=1 Tax=Cerrena zonata TaxID=2478898 RepID=A0AAW0GFW5_9APHY
MIIALRVTILEYVFEESTHLLYWHQSSLKEPGAICRHALSKGKQTQKIQYQNGTESFVFVCRGNSGWLVEISCPFLTQSDLSYVDLPRVTVTGHIIGTRAMQHSAYMCMCMDPHRCW